MSRERTGELDSHPAFVMAVFWHRAYSSFFFVHAEKGSPDNPNFVNFDINIRHKQDGKLFNLRRLKTKSAIVSKLREFLYTEDAVQVTACNRYHKSRKRV